jgi:4-amino-4-deoxy-L-arabinose transferase-like glycosyltransferase
MDAGSVPDGTITAVKLQKLLQRFEIKLIFTVTILGVFLRLIEIWQPFVDAWSWRQADVAMIAENFYRHGFNIFYPQTNWGGPSPGYVGTEFQLIAFIAALFYLLFGVQEWIGRSVSVFFFAVSVPFFYLLVRKVSNERSALFAIGIYTLVPLSIFSGRSFMPDMASLSLSIIALWLFATWLDGEKNLHVFATLCLATSLAILVKLPALIIGIPLLYMSWTKYGPHLLFQRRLWIYATFSLIPPLVWYVHAYFLSIAYFPHHMFGSGLLKIVDISKYTKILLNTTTSHLTPITSILMVVGVILPAYNQFGRLFHWWLLAIIVFIVFVGEGNFRHEWYQLPLVPVAAAFAGVALDFILAKLVETCRLKFLPFVTVISLFILLSYYAYFFAKPLYVSWAIPSLKAGNEVNRIAPPAALIIVPGNGDPTTIYYSKRRGWHFLGNGRVGIYPANSGLAIKDVENLREKGAAYLVLTKETLWYLNWYKGLESHLNSHYGRISDGHDYLIFDLAKKS